MFVVVDLLVLDCASLFMEKVTANGSCLVLSADGICSKGHILTTARRFST